MRRRYTPYSCIEDVRRSRSEVLALVIITVVLGSLLGLLTDGLSGLLQKVMTSTSWHILLGITGALVLGLVVVATWLFHGRTESQRARIDLWLPYHFPTSNKATIARASSYQPPRHARRAFMRRYRSESPELEEFLEAYADARSRGQPFQNFIANDHLALAQCLALYVLHRYGEESLGAKAPFGWWGVDLDSYSLSIDDLPAPLCDNPFLRADQRPDEWRLLLPEDVTFVAHNGKHSGSFETTASRWVLRHHRYGQVTIRWLPQLSVAGPHSQPYEALTTHMRLSEDSQLYVVGARVEGIARLNRTLLPASEPFHRWATGLLARLEEGLDFQYYVATRPERVIRDLEWKVGWVPEGRSIVEMLQTIEGRLEELDMEAVIARMDDPELEEEPQEDFVV